MDECLQNLAFSPFFSKQTAQPFFPLLFASYDACLKRKEFPERRVSMDRLLAVNMVEGQRGEGDEFHDAGAAPIFLEDLKDESQALPLATIPQRRAAMEVEGDGGMGESLRQKRSVRFPGAQEEADLGEFHPLFRYPRSEERGLGKE